MTQNIPEPQKKTIRIALIAGGAGFILGGLLCLLFKDTVNEILADSEGFLAYVLAGALAVVGITDIIIANTLFKENKNIEP